MYTKHLSNFLLINKYLKIFLGLISFVPVLGFFCYYHLEVSFPFEVFNNFWLLFSLRLSISILYSFEVLNNKNVQDGFYRWNWIFGFIWIPLLVIPLYFYLHVLKELNDS